MEEPGGLLQHFFCSVELEADFREVAESLGRRVGLKLKSQLHHRVGLGKLLDLYSPPFSYL